MREPLNALPAAAPALAAPEPEHQDGVTIVIPAFNEAASIAGVVAGVNANLPAAVVEIIVVDDGSTDATAELAEEAGARVIRHASNRGYGASLKTGIRAATTGWVLTMDADGQHDPADVARLCEVVTAPTAPACVIGHRTRLMHSPMWRMPGKWLLTAVAQFLTRKKIPDLNSGLRLMRREVALQYIRLCPHGFSFSTTITLALMSRGHAVDFVPIEVKPRVGKSTVTVSTGFATVLLILRLMTLFNPLRIFLPMSLFCVLAGLAWGVPHVIMREGVTVGSLLLILTGVLLFCLGLTCDQIAQLRLERYE